MKMKKLRHGFDAWGHYLLALLCAGVVLLSAAWTREQRAGENAGRQALSDQSQRLAQVTPPPERDDRCGRPAEGEILCGYSEEPAYFPAFHLWQTHPAVDFAAEDGAKVYAMLAGTVNSCGDGWVRLDHEDGLESLYRGIQQISVSPGQTIRKGAALGLAGGRVPFEGTGRVCVSLLKNGAPIPFEIDDQGIK